MFDDRPKSNGFSENDDKARIKVAIDQKQETNKTPAHELLFGEPKKTPVSETKEALKQDIKQDLFLKRQEKTSLDTLPSSSYLKSFGNKIAEEVEVEAVKQQKETNQEEKKDISEIDFNTLIESASSVKIDNKTINKELEKVAPKPKKNYSFRIKLVAGVYCILVALFGAWVISNSINIANTNANLRETTTKTFEISQSTSEISANITDILTQLKNYDNVTGNPEDETIVVKIITEEIEITPEKVIEPNRYEKSSNWFDVLCNWVSSLFGG